MNPRLFDKQKSVDHDEIKPLVTGLQKFRNKYYSNDDKNSLYKKLTVEGQNPKIMLIACCDSRSNPTDILGMAPGEAFIVRTIANLIPPYDNKPYPNPTAAALEYGVKVLKIKHIILMGHSQCGGIQALNNPDTSALQNLSFISNWVNIAKQASEKVSKDAKNMTPEQKAKACEEESLILSLKNLQTYPWIDSKIRAGILFLHTWRFDLKTGTIQSFNSNSKVFEDVSLETNPITEPFQPKSKL